MKWLTAALLFTIAVAGCLQDTDDTETPEAPAPLVAPARDLDVDRLLSSIESFAATYGDRADNGPAHVGARDFIASEFESLGLEVWRQEFETGLAQENIVGIQWGEYRDQWVVVGGHYDIATKDCSAANQATGLLPIPDPTGGDGAPCGSRAASTGAYDDGSGTMMTIELARAWAGIETNYTIAFVAFDGEERGLEGSGAFAEHVFIDQASPYGNLTAVAMLDLDMIGINWPGTLAPIYFDSNSADLDDVVRTHWEHLGEPADMVEYHGIRLGRSDYAHFFNLGIPTGFFISSFEKWELPNDSGYLVESTDSGTPADGYTAYPFWHFDDTWDTMVAMAGSEADLAAGFDAALSLADATLEEMAMRAHDLAVNPDELPS